MPPHCDALDGPVALAAMEALERADPDLVLPYVPVASEAELLEAYARAAEARNCGAAAREVADRWFCETAVRLHRAGEGAPFTGLKPAGLDVGPVIPVAERAIDEGDPEPLVELLCAAVREEVEHRLQEVGSLGAHAADGVEAGRDYVSASLGLQVWAHGLALAAHARPHEHEVEHTH